MGMTNGQKLQLIIPNLEYEILGDTVLVTNNNNGTWFSLDWWNAEDKEPTTKNNLEVDCVSRAYLLDDNKYHTVFNDDTGNFEDVVYREDIEKAPPVTPQESKTEQFAKWVATEIFDDDWKYNRYVFAEIACRKLAKLGIVRKNGDTWELVEPQESEVKNVD